MPLSFDFATVNFAVHLPAISLLDVGTKQVTLVTTSPGTDLLQRLLQLRLERAREERRGRRVDRALRLRRDPEQREAERSRAPVSAIAMLVREVPAVRSLRASGTRSLTLVMCQPFLVGPPR